MELERYRVGGCVRDALLGRACKDVDWVVVGATEDQMRALGYQRVGSDFPVFLHPETREEHALARTERKSGRGHKGFEVRATPDVSLVEDLARRDLTINAMAQDAEGRLIDPFDGRADLEAGLLRHVGEAFVEDPLRVLRVARFAAQLGFQVAPPTLALMEEMAVSGELDHLTEERVWQETEKAMTSPRPAEYLRVLQACGALQYVFPELHALVDVPQPAAHHPEGCAWTHTLMVMEQAARLTGDPLVRFAAMTHDLGKGLTPPQQWPAHRGHEKAGLPALKKLCARLKAPVKYARFAALVMELHLHHHRALELRVGSVVDLLERLKVRHGTETLERYLLACEADARGRGGMEDRALPQGPYLLAAGQAMRGVGVPPGLTGPEVAVRLHQDQCAAVRRVRADFR